MLVTIISQIYNAKNYIKKCLNSIINQTYKEIEVILVDNGCDDGTENILQQYSEIDDRIKVFRFEENKRTARWYDVLLNYANGDYVVQIDADDWLELDCIEHLLNIAMLNSADIVSTGTCMHVENSSNIFERKIDNQVLIPQDKFADFFTYYHVFFRTVWAKLYKMCLLKELKVLTVDQLGFAYGYDTYMAFSILRNCSKILLDNSVKHHYLIREKSVSSEYSTSQSDSDVFLYKDSLSFLSGYGKISLQNLEFVNVVYSNAVNDTIENVKASYLSCKEKINEYYKIAIRDETLQCYSLSNNCIEKNKKKFIYDVMNLHNSIADKESDEKCIAIYKRLIPLCGKYIKKEFLSLLLDNKKLFNSIFFDKIDLLLLELNKLVRNNVNLSLLFAEEIFSSNRILKNQCYKEIILKDDILLFSIMNETYDVALTRIEKIFSTTEIQNSYNLIQLYILISSLAENCEKYVDGKVKLADYFYCMQDTENFSMIRNELREMGIIISI